jgi:hypothetical protein
LKDHGNHLSFLDPVQQGLTTLLFLIFFFMQGNWPVFYTIVDPLVVLFGTPAQTPRITADPSSGKTFIRSVFVGSSHGKLSIDETPEGMEWFVAADWIFDAENRAVGIRLSAKSCSGSLPNVKVFFSPWAFTPRHWNRTQSHASLFQILGACAGS